MKIGNLQDALSQDAFLNETPVFIITVKQTKFLDNICYRHQKCVLSNNRLLFPRLQTKD